MGGYSSSAGTKRFIVMLQCFVDESGSDLSDVGTFVLAAYIMESARWEDFADRWEVQLKRPFAIEYFHMADAEEGDGEFLGMDRIHRNRKVLDLAGVIEECRPTPVYVSMKWQDYLLYIRGKVDQSLDNPYAAVFFKLLRVLAEMQVQFNGQVPSHIKEKWGIAIKPVDFVFDKQDPKVEQQCIRWYYELRERVQEPHKTILKRNPRFEDDREVLPLQAADMFAWHIRRSYAGDPRKHIFDLIAPDGMIEYEMSATEVATTAVLFKNSDRLDGN
jgi:Protein of unknown function (DUF3800)